MAEKMYNTVNELVEQLRSHYTETTYCHLFSVVENDDWEELELATESLMKEKGDLYNDLHDDDEETTTEEYLEIYGIDSL